MRALDDIMIHLCALELCLTTIITNCHCSLLPLVLNLFFIIEEMLSRGFHHLDVSCKRFERWVFCLHVHNIMLMVCVFGLYFRYVNLWFVFDLNVSSKISHLFKISTFGVRNLTTSLYKIARAQLKHLQKM